MDIAKIQARSFVPVLQDYSDKDTILYNLGIGFGADPTDEATLPFVYEDGLRAVPSMCVVLGYPGAWMRERDSTINWLKMLHGEQAFEIHKPLAPHARIRAEHRITGVEDKGADKGALMVIERQMFDEASGEAIATSWQSMFLRGDGGCGSFGEVPKFATALPTTEPDRVVVEPTPVNQALIYRLSGDYNPIHIDPAAARKAGFERPILHGLALLGIATRVIIREFLRSDPARLVKLAVRFSRPALPGDTIRFEFHEEQDGVLFRAIAVERDQVILDSCNAKFAAC